MKKTRLDDSAFIYTHRPAQTEKQKLRNMDWRNRWQYIKDYYLFKFVILLCIVGFLSSFLYSIFSKKPTTILSVACANLPISTEEALRIEQEIEDYFKINPEEQQVVFDSSYFFSESEYASAQKISVLIATQDLDVFIAPESYFSGYALQGVMADLTKILPSDLYSALSSHFFMSPVIQEELPESTASPSYVLGIRLDKATKLGPRNTEDPMILGIIISGKNTENAISFLRYLLE